EPQTQHTGRGLRRPEHRAGEPCRLTREPQEEARAGARDRAREQPGHLTPRPRLEPQGHPPPRRARPPPPRPAPAAAAPRAPRPPPAPPAAGLGATRSNGSRGRGVQDAVSARERVTWVAAVRNARRGYGSWPRRLGGRLSSGRTSGA